MQTELLVQSNDIPAGLCYSTPQADYPVLASFLRAIFNGNEINFGSSTPAPADRTKPWVRVNPDGTDDGTWVFYNGYWVQKHPLATGLIMLWEGAQTDIATLDGGESAAITNITGPFWEEVTEMAAKSPMHPGTLPAGDVIAIGANFGEDRHTQSIAEIATHDHPATPSSGGRMIATGITPDDGTINRTGSLSYKEVTTTGQSGSSTPFNVVHPVRGIWFLRRTGRLYRRRNA